MEPRPGRLEEELEQRLADERRAAAESARQAASQRAKLRRRVDARPSRLTLRIHDEQVVLKGSRGVHDGAQVWGYTGSGTMLFGGMFAGILAGGPLGLALATSGVGFALLAAALTAFTRVDWALRIEGSAAEFTEEPTWLEARLRRYRRLVPVGEVKIYIFERDTDPSFQLGLGSGASGTTGLSGADLRLLDDLEAWLGARR